MVEPVIALHDVSLTLASRAGPVEILKRVEVDIDLARRPDVADLKTVWCKSVFPQPGFLQRDPFLPFVGHDEAG